MDGTRKICPYCGRPMVKKGELKDCTRGTCNCVWPHHMIPRIEIETDEYIYQEYEEAV